MFLRDVNKNCMCVCVCYLGFVHSYNAMQFLRPVVRGAVGSEPQAEVLLGGMSAVGQAEDVHFIQICL